ncbi:MAG: hypothetical protein V3R99_06090 [Thermoguttaceae bacterium]
MSIWNKVLIGFIFVASVAFFYLGARTLQTHKHWREKAQKFQQRIKAADEEHKTLLGGVLDSDEVADMGVEQLKVELDKILAHRGRVWINCIPEIKPETGQASVTIDMTGPHGIADQTVLRVFEERDIQEGGCFLGEFKVSGVSDDGIGLEPTVPLSDRQLERFDASQGTWTLYEKWPIDSHNVFQEWDDEALTAALPEQSLPEFLSDGEMMTTDEAQEAGLEGRVLAVDESGQILYEDADGNELRLLVDDQTGEARFIDKDGQPVAEEDISEKEVESGKGKYVRILRDYNVIFQDYDTQRTIMIDLIASDTLDKQYAEAAQADSQLQIQFRQDELSRLTAEKKKAERERNAVKTHLATVGRQLEVTQQAVEQIIAQNAADAAQIAQIQKAAKARIDAQTRGVAQVGPATN